MNLFILLMPLDMIAVFFKLFGISLSVIACSLEIIGLIPPGLICTQAIRFRFV